MPNTTKHTPENGNVLFLILIAVALFAALSYAVTSSSRSGGSTASAETVALHASEIIQYAALIESAVTRVKVINGCAETELDFYHANWTTTPNKRSTHNNPSAPSDESCNIYHSNGGGAPWKLGPYENTFYDFTAWKALVNIGTSLPDLIMINVVSEEICMEINKRLGIGSNISESVINQAMFQNGLPYTGGFLSGGGSMFAGASMSDLWGQHTGCYNAQLSADSHSSIYDSSLPAWHFYQVLLAR